MSHVKVNYDSSLGLKSISLNNAKKLNVLSRETINQLSGQVHDQVGLRCILLQAEGSVFCAGHDLQELLDIETAQMVFKSMSDLVMKLQSVPVPVVAVVNGAAVAAGAQLIASCDIVIASTKASFGCPGINVGLFCSTPAVAVSRAANLKVASYMLFTGDRINAQVAKECGLVSLLTTPDALDKETEAMVKNICSKDKQVLALGKKFLHQQNGLHVTSAYELACENMMNNLKVSWRESLFALSYFSMKNSFHSCLK